MRACEPASSWVWHHLLGFAPIVEPAHRIRNTDPKTKSPNGQASGPSPFILARILGDIGRLQDIKVRDKPCVASRLLICFQALMSCARRRASFRAGDDSDTYERKNRLLAAPNGTLVLKRELAPAEAVYAMDAYIVAETERRERCSAGALYYVWNGHSYGVIRSSGIAVTHLGFPPFFELPVDALEPAMPEQSEL